MKQTDKPFPEAVHELLAEKDWSIRELARRTKDETNWGSVSMLALLARGELRPSVNAMESVAKTLRVSPEHFAEYRLAKLRSTLDPEVVGLAKALGNAGQLAARQRRTRRR